MTPSATITTRGTLRLSIAAQSPWCDTVTADSRPINTDPHDSRRGRVWTEREGGEAGRGAHSRQQSDVNITAEQAMSHTD